MWSELWEALHLAQSPNFPVFQGVQARPIILPYVKVCDLANDHTKRSQNRIMLFLFAGTLNFDGPSGTDSARHSLDK